MIRLILYIFVFLFYSFEIQASVFSGHGQSGQGGACRTVLQKIKKFFSSRTEKDSAGPKAIEPDEVLSLPNVHKKNKDDWMGEDFPLLGESIRKGLRIHREGSQIVQLMMAGVVNQRNKQIKGLTDIDSLVVWLTKYMDSQPAFIMENKLPNQTSRHLYDRIAQLREYVGLEQAGTQNELFRQHIELLERYIGKKRLLEVLIYEIDTLAPLLSESREVLFYNMGFLSQHIKLIPSMRDQSEIILSSVLSNRGGLFHMSQMEIGSVENPGLTRKFITFMYKYAGDRRAFINILKSEEFTRLGGAFGNNVYKIVEINIELIENFINSTPGFEGQGKTIIVEGLKTGKFNARIFFDVEQLLEKTQTELPEERAKVIKELFPLLIQQTVLPSTV